jgi:hypothetical protein
MNKARCLLCAVVVGLVVVMGGVCGLGQRQRVAVFVQAAAPIASADLEYVKGYASQRCAAIGGVDVISLGELVYAQRATNFYLGNSISPEGLTKLAGYLDATHIVVFRIVRWEDSISFKPERSLLILGATSFADASLKLLLSPLGLLFGLDKEATVALFATVFGPSGEIQFSTYATYVDRPLFSLLTADPVEAAKRAIDDALYQLAVAL